MEFLIKHIGDVNGIDVDKIIIQIESLIEIKPLIRRISFLSVEILQNIINHSDNKTVSYFSLINDNGTYIIKSGNLIKLESCDILWKRLQCMSTLSMYDVKKEISSKLQNDEFSNKGCAGLGLLSIKRKSSQFSFEIEKIDKRWNLIHFTVIV